MMISWFNPNIYFNLGWLWWYNLRRRMRSVVRLFEIHIYITQIIIMYIYNKFIINYCSSALTH